MKALIILISNITTAILIYFLITSQNILVSKEYITDNITNEHGEYYTEYIQIGQSKYYLIVSDF
jgi:hypothetical protein